MKELFTVSEFDNKMTKTQAVLGWCYLPMHFLVIPLLASLYAVFSPEPVSEIAVNIAYYAVGLAFVAVVMWSWLRRSFDILLDNITKNIINLLVAFAMDYALSIVVSVILLFVGDSLANPNNEAVMDLANQDYGAMKGISIFIAPIVEETLFRGVVFGTIRGKNRVAAYIVSILLFSVYHIWQYVLVYADPYLLLYVLQYIPISFALAWLYERSGSIWTTIFFHMILNALSFYMLSMF